MGIVAPSAADLLAVSFTALVSYNHPVYLASIFVLVFVGVFFTGKKNVKLSLLLALGATVALAVYFVLSFTSQLRY